MIYATQNHTLQENHINMNNDVAAVIVNWNSWDYLIKCITALQKQTVQFDRIVVVDNASDEIDYSIITNWPHRVEFIQAPANLGFAKGNNIAFDFLKAYEFVALVNPDAYLEKDWLENMLSASQRYPKIASFASCLVMANNHNKWDGYGDTYHISGLAWRNGHGQFLNEKYQIEQDVFSACAAAALYRFDALQEAGGFDEDYFCYMEDVDLGFRLRLLGYSCVLVPNAIAYHVGSATTGGERSDFALYHGHRNLVWTYIKNMPGFLFWVLLPLHLIMNLVSIIQFVIVGQGLVILRAKWDALKGVKLMLCKRKQIQAMRKVSVSDIWRVMDKKILLNASDRT